MNNRYQFNIEVRLISQLAVLLCLCCFPLGSIQAQNSRFFNPLFFPTSTYIDALVVADFNADGIADVATCNGFDPGDANILLGNGDGTFGEAHTYAGGTGPADIAVGDFNLDGKLDLVIADKGNDFANTRAPGQAVSVLLGNGDGTFQARRQFNGGTSPGSVAVGDFNGDGKPDVVVANDTEKLGNVTVLLGNGDGNFAAPVAYTTAKQAKVVVARDFNGDGKLDVAAASYLGNVVSVLLGNGDGTFQAHQDFAAGNGPDEMVVADFNGDFKLDLATAGRLTDRELHILLGNGDGTFQAPLDTNLAQLSTALAAGDLNRDGVTDMAIVESGTTVSILLGNGDGTFAAPLNYGGAFVVALGDFRGTGNIDLVGGASRDSEEGIVVIAGNGDGTFQARTELLNIGAATTSQTAGDVNGDGKPDIIATNNYYNNLSVFLNDGAGNFSTRTDYATGDAPWDVAIGDVNNDGKTDIVTANQEGDFAGGSISVLLGNGDGTFQPHTDFDAQTTPQGIVLADFDSDGNLDAATANNVQPGYIRLFFGNGDGTFSSGPSLATGDNPRPIVTEDLNGDGKKDLVVTYAQWCGCDTVSPFVSVFLSNGDGTFQPRTDYPVGAMFESHSVAAGDMNRDGKPDLIVSNTYGSVSVLLGNGDGTFQPEVVYPVNGAWGSVVGDFNGDGNPDVVTGGDFYSDFGTISLLLGNGDGSLQPYLDYFSGSPFTMSAVDLNRDGALDIASSNLFGNSVSIFFNLGGSRVSLTSSENPSHAGDPVTFTARVTPSFAGPVPSGSVKFFDGDNVLGTAVLSGNEASITRSIQNPGTHSITANYLGDSTFLRTRSKKLTQKVRP
ncbi:MAG TPA: FG-GAP-like repeat-containing protein [Candidatus Binataceae bacterium]|nr:FG-GAP-like repeat-containing protein [Candidatus Binataceae bacterium]